MTLGELRVVVASIGPEHDAVELLLTVQDEDGELFYGDVSDVYLDDEDDGTKILAVDGFLDEADEAGEEEEEAPPEPS